LRRKVEVEGIEVGDAVLTALRNAG
jgi:hypothetical protein